MTPTNVILAGIVGSTSHGLNFPGHDDTDVMGVFVERPDEVMGIGRHDHETRRTAPKGARSGPGDVDEVYYSLRKFARLAAAGNPSILVLLFLDDYLVREGPGGELTFYADRFVSRSAGERFLGYLRSQRGKLERSRGPGAHRPELVEEFGYDTKYAMHMVRLAYQGIELMQTGRLILPMKEPARSHCMAVRRGEIDYRRVLKEAGWLEERLIGAIDEADLPRRADLAKINEWLVDLHRDWWEDCG